MSSENTRLAEPRLVEASLHKVQQRLQRIHQLNEDVAQSTQEPPPEPAFIPEAQAMNIETFKVPVESA